MAQDYSFDVVSQFDRQELVNAVNQAQREIVTRYDFKDTGASIDLGENEITLNGPSDFKLKAMLDVLQGKLVKRQLSLKILKPGPIEQAALEVWGPRDRPGTFEYVRAATSVLPPVQSNWRTGADAT